MKKMKLVYFSAFLLLLASCKKNDDVIPSGVNKEINQNKKQEKESTLKSLRHYLNNSPSDFRLIIYNFHFNKKRQLDSIVMDPGDLGAQYIFHSKNRIDSVVETLFYYPNGYRIAVRSGFEYDREGNFTRFNILGVPNAYRQRVKITYDQGHVHAVIQSDLQNPSLTTYDKFDYFKNDIVRWSAFLPPSPMQSAVYTYDQKHYNPLYEVADDLLAIFSGHRTYLNWEFFLGSEHVTTSKYYEQSRKLFKYENYYDRKDRLIKKVFTEPQFTRPDSLIFEYVK